MFNFPGEHKHSHCRPQNSLAEVEEVPPYSPQRNQQHQQLQQRQRAQQRQHSASAMTLHDPQQQQQLQQQYGDTDDADENQPLTLDNDEDSTPVHQPTQMMVTPAVRMTLCVPMRREPLSIVGSLHSARVSAAAAPETQRSI